MATRYNRNKNVNRVFVYGELMKGFDLHEVYAYDSHTAVDGYIEGVLYDMGNYPALVGGQGIVFGQILEFADIETALLRLDDLEGFFGEGCDNFFERVLVKAVGFNDGREVLVWTYFYPGNLDEGVLIEEGDWKEYYITRELNKGLLL